MSKVSGWLLIDRSTQEYLIVARMLCQVAPLQGGDGGHVEGTKRWK